MQGVYRTICINRPSFKPSRKTNLTVLSTRRSGCTWQFFNWSLNIYITYSWSQKNLSHWLMSFLLGSLPTFWGNGAISLLPPWITSTVIKEQLICKLIHKIKANGKLDTCSLGSWVSGEASWPSARLSDMMKSPSSYLWWYRRPGSFMISSYTSNTQIIVWIKKSNQALNSDPFFHRKTIQNTPFQQQINDVGWKVEGQTFSS